MDHAATGASVKFISLHALLLAATMGRIAFVAALSKFAPVTANGEAAALMILPGLDGTEVLFRSFSAVLPEWIRSVAVCHPTVGANGYAELLPLVQNKAAETPDRSTS